MAVKTDEMEAEVLQRGLRAEKGWGGKSSAIALFNFSIYRGIVGAQDGYLARLEKGKYSFHAAANGLNP